MRCWSSDSSRWAPGASGGAQGCLGASWSIRVSGTSGDLLGCLGGSWHIWGTGNSSRWAPGCLRASWGVWVALGHLGGSQHVWWLLGYLGGSGGIWGAPGVSGGSQGFWGTPGMSGGSWHVEETGSLALAPPHSVGLSVGLSVDELDVSAVPHCCPLGLAYEAAVAWPISHPSVCLRVLTLYVCIIGSLWVKMQGLGVARWSSHMARAPQVLLNS